MSDSILDHCITYNRHIGNPLSESLKTRLKNGAQLVIAGQQPGLLFGPLYTFWKYLTAVNLASEVSALSGRDLVPAFWIASEDHDIQEVNRVMIKGDTFTAEPDFPAVRGKLRPVGTVPLNSWREPLLTFLNHTLADQPFTVWLTDTLAACDFTSYSTFFATMATALFGKMHECVFIDAMKIRPLTGQFMADAVSHRFECEQSIQNGARVLQTNGYSPPLFDCGIFEIQNNQHSARIKCRFENDRMICSAGNFSIHDAADHVRAHPEQFSAGAALRPILQDSLFPVAITVCGPSEMLYLWQIDSLYKVLNVPRSLLYPRISATVFPLSSHRHMQKIRSMDSVFDLSHQSASVVSNLSDIHRLETSRDTLIHDIHLLQNGDPLMQDKAVKAVTHHIGKLVDNVMIKRRDAADSEHVHIRKLQQCAFIDGKPQERVMNLCEVLSGAGPEWLEHVFEHMSPLNTAHQLVMMPFPG